MLHIPVVKYDKGDKQTQNVQEKNRWSNKK